MRDDVRSSFEKRRSSKKKRKLVFFILFIQRASAYEFESTTSGIGLLSIREAMVKVEYEASETKQFRA
jgi:hypothetical protein